MYLGTQFQFIIRTVLRIVHSCWVEFAIMRSEDSLTFLGRVDGLDPYCYIHFPTPRT